MGSNDGEVPDPKPKAIREILRDVSAEQGWTPETEISVLCDFLDECGTGVMYGYETVIIAQEFLEYLRDRCCVFGILLDD